MIHRLGTLAVLLWCGLAGTARAAGYQYTITDLGSLAVGEASHACAISPNGRYIAGHADDWFPSFPFQEIVGDLFLYADGGPMQSVVEGTPWSHSPRVRRVNDGAQFVGSVNTSEGIRAFRYTPTIGLEILGTLGGTSGDPLLRPISAAFSINDAGQLVGDSSVADGSTHAFLSTGSGSMIDLGTLGGAYSHARDINAAAQIVGGAQAADGACHAFLYEGGVMRDLGILGQYSFADAINDRGQVVGRFTALDGSVHAFAYSDGAMRDLGTTAMEVIADFNNHGQMVGGGATAILANIDGTSIDLNDLIAPGSGWRLTHATGINDQGQIVGYGIAPDGQMRGFLLTPVPEPSTLALLGIAAGLLTCGGWRGRAALRRGL